MRTPSSSTIWASGSNGQLLTHSNHLGTAELRRLDGEIHFHTPGKDIAGLELDEFLVGPVVVVELSDATGDYQIYTSQSIGDRVEVREGDILIIHTGYHHFGPAPCPADEIRCMVLTPARTASSPSGPRRKRSAGSGSTVAAPTTRCLHLAALACRQDRQAQVNTIIRTWMPRQAAEADKL